MTIFSFNKEIILKKEDLSGRDWLGTTEEGASHFQDIESFIKKTPASELIIFDISDLKFIGYSYSKQTIRRALQTLINKYYGERSFLVYSSSKEQCAELDSCLREESLLMIASTGDIQCFYNDYFLIGKFSLQESSIIKEIIEKKQVTSAEISELFSVSQQVASNILKKLADNRVIRRIEPNDRSGNVWYYGRIEVS
jgi:hypothetical protein